MERNKKLHPDGKHHDIARCYKMISFMYAKFNLEDEAQNALDKAKAIYSELDG